MPRRHEAIEGQMNASTEGNSGYEHYGVEVRILRGDSPGTVSIILPNAPIFRHVAEQGEPYDWTDPHQVDGVQVSQLVDALVEHGQLERFTDGTLAIPENPPFGK